MVKKIVFYSYHGLIFAFAIILGALSAYRLLSPTWEAIRNIAILLSLIAIFITIFGTFREDIMKTIERMAKIGEEFFGELLRKITAAIGWIWDALCIATKKIYKWHKPVFDTLGFTRITEEWDETIKKERRDTTTIITAPREEPITTSPQEKKTVTIKPFAILGTLVLLTAEGGILFWLLYETFTSLLEKTYLPQYLITGFASVITLAFEFIIIFIGEKFLSSTKQLTKYIWHNKYKPDDDPRKNSLEEFINYYGSWVNAFFGGVFFLAFAVAQVYIVQARVELFENLGRQPPYILKMLVDIIPIFYLLSIATIYLLATMGGSILGAFGFGRTQKDKVQNTGVKSKSGWIGKLLKIVALAPVLLFYFIVVVIPTFTLTLAAIIAVWAFLGVIFLPCGAAWLLLKLWQFAMTPAMSILDIITKICRAFVMPVSDIWPFKYILNNDESNTNSTHPDANSSKTESLTVVKK